MVACCLNIIFEPRRPIDVERKKARERHLKNAVVPLPSIRQRSLSIPLIKESLSGLNSRRSKQRTNNQFQSPFFSKLPAEIRRKIYIEVLGERVLNIFKDETARYVKWLRQGRSLLAFPMTCRRMYDFIHFCFPLPHPLLSLALELAMRPTGVFLANQLGETDTLKQSTCSTATIPSFSMTSTPSSGLLPRSSRSGWQQSALYT